MAYLQTRCLSLHMQLVQCTVSVELQVGWQLIEARLCVVQHHAESTLMSS